MQQPLGQCVVINRCASMPVIDPVSVIPNNTAPPSLTESISEVRLSSLAPRLHTLRTAPLSMLPLHTPDVASDKETIQAFHRLCRTCASALDSPMVAIFSPHGRDTNLPDMINSCLPVKVRQDDGFPQQICQECVLRLSMTSSIITSCKEAEDTFRRMVFESTSAEVHSIAPPHDSVEAESHSVGADYRYSLSLHEDSILDLDTPPSHQAEIRDPLDQDDDCIQETDAEAAMTSGAETEDDVAETSGAEDVAAADPCKKASPHPMVCDICPSTFWSIAGYLQHQKLGHMRCLVCCTKCYLSFKVKRKDFQEHLKDMHAGENTRKVGATYKSIFRPKKTKIRRKIHYICTHCNLDMRTKKRLTRHRQRVHENIFKCRSCAKISASMEEQKEHNKTHLNKRKCSNSLKCKHCEHVANNKQLLRLHIKTEHVSKVYSVRCDKCCRSFRDRSALDFHRDSKHSNETVNTHLCPECGNIQNTLSGYKKHMLKHLPREEGGSVECSICDTLIKGDCFVTHMRSHLNERPYACSLCQVSFLDESRHQKHMEGHVGKDSYCCKICNLTFDNEDNFGIHKSKHREDKTGYVCQVCRKKVSEFDDLVKHCEITHTPSQLEKVRMTNIFRCGKCLWTCTSHHSYLSHRSSHATEANRDGPIDRQAILTCNICGQRCDDVMNFAAHKRSHPESFLLKCHYCEKRVSTHRAREDHQEAHHSKELQNLPSCDICFRVFKSEKALTDHKLRWHSKVQPDDLPFVCRHCDRRFKYPIYLDRHMVTHTDGTMLQCEYCSQKLRNPKAYRIHIDSHLNPDRFKCDSCSYKTSRKKNLRLHLIKHSNVKSYQCEFCAKTFKRQENMRSHRAVHTQGKSLKQAWLEKRAETMDTSTKNVNPPYQITFHCDTCALGFDNEEKYVMHQIQRHNSTDFVLKCNECSYETYDLKQLRNHQRKHDVKLDAQ